MRDQLRDYDSVARLNSNDPEVQKWVSITTGVFHAAFGKPNGEFHDLTKEFVYIVGALSLGKNDSFYERKHQESMQRKRAALESAIRQLEILGPPIAQVAPEKYNFHAEIESVAGHLFRDGHYKPAALEAFIRVIQEVKNRSGLSLEGDNLMNQAFGCDGRIPPLKFNELQTDADRDEQKGFMYLFKGVVSMRNLKAHSNRSFDDPLRAHEYLSLASLLMRALELTSQEVKERP